MRRLNEAFNKASELPEIKERLSSLGLATRSSSPEQFARHLKSETQKVDQLVKSAGIKFD